MFRCIAKIVNPHFLIRFLLVTLTTLLLTFLGSGEKFAMAGTATLTWTAPTTNVDGTPLTDLTGYRIYFSQSALTGQPLTGCAAQPFVASASASPAANTTVQTTLPGLLDGTPYYFAV